jgi:NAD(P)-dependent dehydrogenase (short-subunit alcohol dehydrogenase family)
VVDIDTEEANKVVNEIVGLGRRSMAMRVNVTKFNEAQSMAKTVLDKWGKIDILINNVGGGAEIGTSLFHEKTEEAWDYVVAVTLKSVFNCSRSVIEHMIQRKSGKIVSTASCAGLVGDPGVVDYSAAKAGVIGFTMALAKEVFSYGINVNCVAPGPIETRVMSQLPPERVEHFRHITGLGRLGKPEEVAAVVVFLTLDEASFITGQVYPVCGLRNLGT